jgi:N-acyl homoserine lactone hydrolase
MLMENLTIHPIPLFIVAAKREKPRMTHLFYSGEDVQVCCYVWYIEGAGENILVDAGGTAETVVARGRPREWITQVQSLEEGLAKFQLKPGDIDTVIVTHLHWDHIELARKLVNARFIVQEDELNAVNNPDLADPGCEKDYFEGLNFEVVKGDTQITRGVKVLLTPGHSAGGQSVAIETEKGIAVIAGFCCIRENFEPGEEIRKTTPFILPGIHIDAQQAHDSMLKVIQAADIIIPLHDPEFAHTDRIP